MFIGCAVVVIGTAVQATANGCESLFFIFSFFEIFFVALKLLTS